MTHAAKLLLRLGVNPAVIVRLERIADGNGLTLREEIQRVLVEHADKYDPQ